MHARSLVVIGALASLTQAASAQSRVGTDSSSRIDRLERDLAYGTVEGFGYAGLDQYDLSPPQWGTGWHGYQRRLVSDVGEFWVQEVATEGLAAAMNRPLDYKRCRCRDFGARMAHALRGALFDQMPRGREALAIPRIVGAYGGAYAQTTWRPGGSSSRASLTLTNGTTSLAIGALIDIYHEFRR
jgi:hypothetical protein